MRIARVRKSGRIVPVIIAGEELIDVSATAVDFNSAFFRDGGLAGLAALDLRGQPRVQDFDGYAPPVASPSKIVCIGLNYHEHAREAGLATPSEPVLFLKAPSALSGPNDPVLLPPDSTRLDWEIELALCVSRRLRHATPEQALASVAGYMIFNDVSERSFQLDRGGQWTKGKSYDSFAPLGPVLATPDEVGNAADLEMILRVNGQVMQVGRTSDMIFAIPEALAYISRHMTLEPGDVVATGTPSGVGLGHKPPVYLRAGDRMELEIQGLGRQRQQVVADRAYDGEGVA